MQNPGEETGWARCGAGPHAPRPPQTPAPTRAPQHPGVHLPARGCCRTAALRGHPARYVPATPAAIVTTVPTVPTAGPWGEPVSLALPRTLSPSTGRGAAGGLGLQRVDLVVAQQRPAPARWLFPRSLPVPRCPQRGSWHVCAVSGLRAATAAAPRPVTDGPAGTASPGHAGVGTRALGAARGWERTRRSREPGLPGHVALSPRGEVTEVAPGWGRSAAAVGTPDWVNFTLCHSSCGRIPSGIPQFCFKRFLCADLLFLSPWVYPPPVRPSPVNELLDEASAAHSSSKRSLNPPKFPFVSCRAVLCWGECGFGREAELGEGEGASGLRVVSGAPPSPGAGGLLGWPRSPRILALGDGGQVLACRGSDPPPPPAAGGTRDSSGLRGLGAPAEPCQTRCARGVVPRCDKRGAQGLSWVLYPKRPRRGPWATGGSHKPQTWGGGLPPRWSLPHRDGATTRHFGGHRGTVTPKCCPIALTTPPLPRLLLTAAHSSGTAALFTPDRSAHVVTAGCCKPGPARSAAVAAGAVTPSAEPGLAAEPGHAHPKHPAGDTEPP